MKSETGKSSPRTTASTSDVKQVQLANESWRVPVMFVHGLWLLSNSWEGWAEYFEEAGYVAMAPGWPGDPGTVTKARVESERLPNNSLREITDHYEHIIRGLAKKPAVIGHSLGGLITEVLAGRGLARVSVAIDPAPFRGVLPIRMSAIKSARPVLGNPANRKRAVSLSYDHFRYSFANAINDEEAKTLYDAFAVPSSGMPLFQSAMANLNPWTAARPDTMNPARGPLLIISGGKDNIVPPAMSNASYRKQRRNKAVTEIVELSDRGHTLTIDSGWRQVAEIALAFIERFAPPTTGAPLT